MAKQTFTAGQVLTAAQMTSLQANDYNWSTNAQTASYVLVAADAGKTVTMTSASATTITVNNSLFTAGDRVQVINLGAGTCTITAGTATVNSASSLALVQYQSGTIWFSTASAAIFIPDDKTVSSGLVFIGSTTASAATTITVDNVFTSTYRRYMITSQISGGTTNGLQLQFRYGSTTQAASYYSAANIAANGGTSGVTAIANGSVIRLQGNRGLTMQTIWVDYVGNASEKAMCHWQGWGSDQGEAFSGAGYVNAAQTYTGVIFSNSTAAADMTGTVRVYGVVNS